MRIDRIPHFHSNRLARDYIEEHSQIKHRYNGFSSEPSSYSARIEYLAQRPLALDRQQLTSVLLAYNRSVGNHANALANIETLQSEDALVITGGQQAGLFTGPLMVIYKAVTIIRQAREAARRHGRPVIPVFWIAGEDHDFAEVDHVHVLKSNLETHKVQLRKPDQARASISHLAIAHEDWEDVLRQLTHLLPDTDSKPEFLNRLGLFCRDARTLSEAFARIMAWLFGEEGLVLVDSADPALRKVEAPMWQQLIRENETLSHAYLQGASDLQKLGYDPQADVHPDGANLFYYDNGERLLLFRRGDAFADKQGLVSLSQDGLLELAAREPDKLSNNVLTRPLMQDFVFPVLAVVLGPGEIAYWGQLKEAFASLQMEMPVIIPREGYTLLESADQKILAKYELTIEDAMHRLAEKREQWLKSQDTMGLEEEFLALEARIEEWYEPLVAKAAHISPVMRDLGAVNQAKVLDQVRYYRSRVMGELAARHELALRQFDRLAAVLSPSGIPQERFYNVFYYLNRYGDDWLRKLIHEHQPDPLDSKHHGIVYL